MKRNKLKSRRNHAAQLPDHLDYRHELASIVVAVLHSGVATEMGYGIENWTVVTAREPSATRAGMANLPPNLASAPGFSIEMAKLTLDCDPCTSSFFPKGDDGNER